MKYIKHIMTLSLLLIFVTVFSACSKKYDPQKLFFIKGVSGEAITTDIKGGFIVPRIIELKKQKFEYFYNNPFQSNTVEIIKTDTEYKYSFPNKRIDEQITFKISARLSGTNKLIKDFELSFHIIGEINDTEQLVVSFKHGNTIFQETNVTKGGLLTKPANPTPLTNNIFVCWLYNRLPFDFNNPINTNITLEALFVNNFYSILEDTNTSYEIFNKLRTNVNKVTLKNYGAARYDLAKTDVDPNKPDKLLGIYDSTLFPNKWSGGTDWNREHVWPNSRMGEDAHCQNRDVGIVSDLHNLRVCDRGENSSRSNRHFVLSDKSYSPLNGHKVGDAYFPGELHKGDVSRILLYMVTKWKQVKLVKNPPVKTSYSDKVTEMGDLTLLLNWHNEDKVDQFEINRNDKIYEIQKNRNPYIDCPELFEIVWTYLMKQENLLSASVTKKVNTLEMYHKIIKYYRKEERVY